MDRRLHKADQKFSQWLKDHGFDDIKSATRADAMRLADNWSIAAINLDCEITHPQRIRDWHRVNQKTIELPADLQNLTIEQKPPVELDARSAERIAKDIKRAEAGGEKN